jgi:hypothetical protein
VLSCLKATLEKVFKPGLKNEIELNTTGYIKTLIYCGAEGPLTGCCLISL